MVDNPEPGVLGEVDPTVLTNMPVVGQEDELHSTPTLDPVSDEEGDVFIIDQE